MSSDDKYGKSLIGAEIEIPVHYDLWMQGARFGKVTAFREGKGGTSSYVLVKINHPRVHGRLKIWALDWDYIRIL
jgi:hypothetical protein